MGKMYTAVGAIKAHVIEFYGGRGRDDGRKRWQEPMWKEKIESYGSEINIGE